jgi:hypothetical protein
VVCIFLYFFLYLLQKQDAPVAVFDRRESPESLSLGGDRRHLNYRFFPELKSELPPIKY